MKIQQNRRIRSVQRVQLLGDCCIHAIRGSLNFSSESLLHSGRIGSTRRIDLDGSGGQRLLGKRMRHLLPLLVIVLLEVVEDDDALWAVDDLKVAAKD